MSGMTRSTWTVERDALLMKMWRAKPHVTLREMAERLHVSKTTCAKRLTALNYPQRDRPTISKPKPEKRATTIHMRRCLGCRQLFQPSHAGQYFHPKCKPTESSDSHSIRIPARKAF